MELALFAYVVANLADIISTNRVLDRGGVELNPVMRWAMKQFGRLWFIPKLALAGVAAAGCIYMGWVWAVWVGAAIYAIVAANNFRVAQKIHQPH